MRLLLCLVCFPAILCAQSIAIPHSGITFDGNSKSFRPVLGVPGAARLGDALEFHGEWHNVAICSPQQFAVAASGREGAVTLIHLDSLTTNEVSQGLATTPSQIQLSAGCSAAAVYSAQTNRLQVVTGLPAKAVLAAELTLDLPGPTGSLAISDDGQLAVAAVPGKAIYLVPAAGRAISLMPIESGAAVGMRGNTDVLVADQFSNTVTLIEDAAGSPLATVLGHPADGIDAPNAVWFDSRTAKVLVTNAGNSKVSLLAVSGGSSEVIECQCQLSGLSPLTDRSYQLQAPASGQPLRILDLEASRPRVVFVATPEGPTFPKGRHTASSEDSKN